MQQEIDSMAAASRAINRVIRKGRFAELNLVNGIVLEIKPVPPLLLNAVLKEFPDPEVPTVHMEELGRDEPNPNSPAYIQALVDAGEARDKAVNDLVLAAGTSVKTVPEGYYRPEEDGWVANVEFASRMVGKHIEVSTEEEDSVTRYLQWLRYYALETSLDIALAQSLSYQLAGIREGEIDEVIESFQRQPERGADSVGEAEAGSPNGDTDNRAARRARPRVRRA